MPSKKKQITDEERAKRIEEAARELGTSNDPASFDCAFEKVVKPPSIKPKSEEPKK